MSTVTWITARGLFGRRRFLLLLPLPALLLVLAIVSRSLGVHPSEWGPPVLVGLGLAVVLPVVALIVGTGVLGAEIDDGTVVHILTKPLPRWQIVLPKLAVATGVSAATVAVPLYVAGVLADSVRLGLALAAASALGALAYSAFFLALSLLTRRPVLLGLVYVLIWEGLLGRFVDGTRVLSIQQWVIAFADRMAPTDLLGTTVSVPVAVVLTALVAVGSTILAIDRLRSFSVAGETS
ncbi:ABC transporter permease subunit [Micromonospora narathiwatensis]|uniref:ABC-2 type transport system permease protein n=1 Tax=Micromonospora narathiwatensis TaxID=299146 RepID=A0A1A9A4V6_9ACTN|nr:ABC transporter permease subunit [Micromonospora narathiwatensis]SBT51146.1 ABC-2 type transport system permease protein [Micromonospora narathiwatensis]